MESLEEQIQILRAETGSCLLSCKEALRWSKGDYSKALKFLTSNRNLPLESSYRWFVPKDGRGVLQFYNNVEWVEVPTVYEE